MNNKSKIKKYDNGVLKTELSADGKTVHFSIKVSDLKLLFKTCSENFDGSNIRRGREREFIDYVLERMDEPSMWNDDTVKWALPFEEIFQEILESAEDFVNYKES